MANRELSVHTEHEFLLKMEKAGLNETLAQKVTEDRGNELARRVVAYIQRGGYEATTSQRRAKEIMGKNMPDIGDAIQHFGIAFSDEQRAQLADIPWPEPVLQECKDTHILFPGYPLTVLEIRERMPRGHFRSYESSWYNTENFAKKEKVGCQWYLLRKEPILKSFSKTFQEQEQLLNNQEEVPRACELVFGTMLLERVTKERLFRGVCGRCRDLDSSGCRVSVGGFSSVGLSVGYWFGDSRDGDLGLATARKFPIS